MKAIIVNDVHSCDRSPHNRSSSYSDDIFDKLKYIVSLTEDPVYTFLAFTGDLFHFPQPSKVSHFLVSRWFDILDSVKCPVYIVPGNHDLSSGRLDSLPKQPIGLLSKHPSVEILHSGKRIRTDDGIDIAGVEWNYSTDSFFIRDKLGKTCDILLTHAPISPVSNPFYSTISYSELSGIAKFICYGHIHNQHPVEIIDSTIFVNPGALSRGSLSDDDLKRKPSIAIIDFFDNSVSYLAVPYKPATDVFFMEAANIKKENRESIEKFIANLNLTSISKITVESIISEVSKITDNQQVIEKIREFLLYAR